MKLYITRRVGGCQLVFIWTLTSATVSVSASEAVRKYETTENRNWGLLWTIWL